MEFGSRKAQEAYTELLKKIEENMKRVEKIANKAGDGRNPSVVAGLLQLQFDQCRKAMETAHEMDIRERALETQIEHFTKSKKDEVVFH